ncbi:MAG: sulfite exporter TauE/SafE family protein [Alphaproteobacteria bacterium]|nr:sulfite exporter TauE/SafE family protein [Alphaproteobacteria bacterium]
MDPDLLLYALIGFIAQLVDSSLGMAFGSLSSSLLLSAGFPPHSLSATVHTAEIFGGGAATISHWRIKNIDMDLFKKLAFPAVIGAILGILLVTHFDNETLKPWLGLYFMIIGSLVVIKTLRPSLIRTIKTHRTTLGFIGGFLDAFGGAGWGEFVSSGLLLRGHEVRSAVGSLVAAEFAVSLTVSLVFFSTAGIAHWPAILALSIGAITAAPLGAIICKKVPRIPLMLGVGTVIILVGLKTFSGV